MRLSLRGVTQNWRLKLAALALAVLLWAVVTAEQPTTRWIPVRVEPVLRDPGYVAGGGPDPAAVRVRFSGAGRELWQLALERPVLELPIRNVGSARSFALDPQMVRVPEGLSVRVLDVRPAVVRLDLQRLTTRLVPVRPRPGEASLGRYLLDSLRAAPAAVRLTGPEDVLARMDGVPTVPFEVVPEPGDSSFSRLAALDTAELAGITLSTRQVRVSGRLDPRETRVVPAVPVWTPQGAAATPGQVEVRVEGGRRALAGFSPTALRAVVSRDSLPAALPAAGAVASVTVEGAPPGTTARAVPARVRVTPATLAPPAAPADSPARPR
ncbi:MAG TPA: hypothetical protein VEW03_13500 [Longimicrobiaceae bacterium]|nr:hypothetical protein [Longimicrobiaceae bacterium]